MPLSLSVRHQPAHRLSPFEERRSRYGRDEFPLHPNFLRAAALDASTSSPVFSKQRHQTVRLSVIDITSPTSLTTMSTCSGNDIPMTPLTPDDDEQL